MIALGFFDGVHLGHAALMRRAKEMSQRLGVSSLALTFDRHPDELIKGAEVPLLNTKDERKQIIRQRYGIDEVAFEVFDRKMMRMPWDRYVEDILILKYGAVHLVAGHDHRFGYMGEGNAASLKERCAQKGIGCDIIPKVEMKGVTVSSTHIRSLIASGDVERAAEFLGYRHFITGRAARGRGIGHRELYATANIALPHGLVPPARGVYAARALFDGQIYDAVTNVGRHPTVGETEETVIETHLLNYSGELYGKELRIFFYKHLRDEKKFQDVPALRAQITEDIISAAAYLREIPSEDILR